MSIDLGNAPTPPNTAPTLAQKEQIRNSIAALKRPDVFGSDNVAFIAYSGSPMASLWLDSETNQIYWGANDPIAIYDLAAGATSFHFCKYITSTWDVLQNLTGSFYVSAYSPVQFEFGVFQYSTISAFTAVFCKYIPESTFAGSGIQFVQFGAPYSTNPYALVETIDVQAFFECTSLSEALIYGAKYVMDGAFSGCLALTSFPILGNRLEYIGSAAFQNCANLVTVDLTTFPLSEIGGSAFSLMDSLQTIRLPDSVGAIGDYAFNACPNLVNFEVYSMNPPTTVGIDIFDGCTNLLEVQVPVGAGANWGTTWQGLTVVESLV